jgi:hypothetical protein
MAFRISLRWLTPPANFPLSRRDGRKTKTALTTCHSSLLLIPILPIRLRGTDARRAPLHTRWRFLADFDHPVFDIEDPVEDVERAVIVGDDDDPGIFLVGDFGEKLHDLAA